MAGTYSGGPAHPSMAANNSPKVEETVDYSNLPCPLPYEEIHRELNNSLKPEHFEGMHFDFIKYISPKLSLSHSVSMGAEEIPTQHPEIIKIPTAQYVFGAMFSDPKMLLIGRLMTDGRLTAKLKCDLTENLTLKGDAQVTSEPGMSHGMGAFDYKGRDYRAQLQLGSGALIGANYVQSVTPNLSLGGEVSWTGAHRRSGVGYSARYCTDKMVATGQVASTGVVMLGYVQNIGKGISLATDFMYNYLSKETTASVGYDHSFNQSRVRGKIDSNGCVSSFMEYLISPVLTCRFSGEVDHRKKDYKFGLGLLVGQ